MNQELTMKFSKKKCLAATLLAACAGTASAANWSDTYVGYRWEPTLPSPSARPTSPRASSIWRM
jgi:opacity protein-like surface antigen